MQYIPDLAQWVRENKWISDTEVEFPFAGQGILVDERKPAL